MDVIAAYSKENGLSSLIHEKSPKRERKERSEKTGPAKKKGDTHAESFRLFKKHKNDYLVGVITDNLTRGIKEELYRPDIQVDLLARFRVESIVLPFNPEFHSNIKASLADIEQELTYHFLFGIVSLKGYKLSLKYQQERSKKTETDGSKKIS